MTNRKPAKPYWEMTTAELREATKEYDKPFSAEKVVKPPPEELAKMRRFKAKMGRPRRGAGSKQIAVTIERRLLKRTDAYARKAGLSRSAVIAVGIERLIGTEA